MATTPKARKRCSKCGRTVMVRPRVRRCPRVDPKDAGFAHKYACWGALVAAERRAKKAPRSVASPVARVDKALAAARIKQREHAIAAGRSMTLSRKWARKVAQLEARFRAETEKAAALAAVVGSGAVRMIEVGDE